MSIEGFAWADHARVILYHSQSTSARTLFLQHASGSVLAPLPLPPLSTLLDEDEFQPGQEAVVIHPSALIHDYCAKLGVDVGLLRVDGEFQQWVDVPGGIITVYLARFTCVDPPRKLFAERGCTFSPITELRGRHPAEMGLLQRAYEAIMG
jgi:hypothetical protein